MTYDSSNPATVERELAETRARLDAHLDELTSRLSPGQLVDDGLNYLRHGQGAEFARNLGSQLRDNPLPVAVTGIGLTWLMAISAMSGNKASWPTDKNGGFGDDAVDDLAARAQLAGESLPRLADESEDAFNSRVAAARARVLGLQQEAMETASAFVDRVQQALESSEQVARERLAQLGQAAADVGGAVADRTRRTGDAMAQAAQQGRDMASRTATAIAETLDQNPMLLGAVGLTAGVLLAALLPVTEPEEALAASAGDAIRTAAEQALERGKRAAEAAAATAYREVTTSEP